MKKLVLCLSTLACAGFAQAQTKWDLPTGYGANTFQTQNLQQFVNDVNANSGGKLTITAVIIQRKEAKKTKLET